MTHHYCYGSGMVGCLYDYGPSFAPEREDAVGALTDLFSESLSETELQEMQENLRTVGIHYFSQPSEAGAHYCDVSEHPGACPDDEEES